MDGIPGITIPTILSFLEPRDFHRCACIAKEWASCVQKMLTEMREESAAARAQMSDAERVEADQRIREEARDGNPNEVQLLISRGANVESTNHYGETVLMLASINCKIQTVEMLISRGANTEAANISGKTALMVAAYNGLTRIVKILIGAGADVDVRGRWNQTPLFQAARDDRRTIAIALISGGADVNVRSIHEETALDVATSRGHSELATILEEAGAKAATEL